MADRRFTVLVEMVAGVLALLTLIVVAAGDQTEPFPVSVQPPDGAADVGAGGSLVLRFGRPVARDSVAAALRIEPPTPGALDVDRSVVRFMPTGGFRPGTRYTVTLATGFRDLSGRALRRDVQTSFTTRPARLLISRPESGASSALAARNLWVLGLDGALPRPLTREPLGILFATVAPDGERVAYSSMEAAEPDASALWVVGVDGSGRQRIAGDADGAILALSWSPRGDLIAYERRSVVGVRGELGRPRILAVRPDGGGAGLLYGRGDEAGGLPVWSPDGLRLLGVEAAGGRVVVEPSGPVVRIPGAGTDSGSWSPDGQQIAFPDLIEQADATRSVIRIADRHGGPVANLARPGFSDTAPAWSPDGQRIAVVGQADDGALGIWLLDPTGTSGATLIPLTGEAGSAAVSLQFAPPVWSSGGTLLAFGRLVAGDPQRGGAPIWELWIARGDGSGARQLPIEGLPEGWIP